MWRSTPEKVYFFADSRFFYNPKVMKIGTDELTALGSKSIPYFPERANTKT